MSLEIDPKSVGTHCLTPYAYSQPLGTASGFLVEHQGVIVLVTNYHVLSGRHPVTGEQMSEALPDRLLIPLLSQISPDLAWTAHVQRLLNESGRPCWVEHPSLGRQLDVVALPIDPPPFSIPVPYELDPGPALDLPLASELAIIGFPMGVAGAGLTAIWKAGTIASEPSMPVNGEDYFWIDANTRKGMSGSPVVARRFGGAVMQDGNYNLGRRITDRTLGVYAGRAYDAPDMTLGRVWRWDRVSEVIASAVSKVHCGVIEPQLCQVGYLPQTNSTMVKLNVNESVDVQATDPQGNPVARSFSLSRLIRLWLSDSRFGTNLKSVRKAASLEAALDEAEAGDGELELEEEDYALMREIAQNPSNAYNPNIVKHMLPLIDQFLNAGNREE